MRKIMMGFAGASAITGLMSFAAELRDLDASGRPADLVHLMSGNDETSAVENRKVVIAVAACGPGQPTYALSVVPPTSTMPFHRRSQVLEPLIPNRLRSRPFW